MNLNVRESGFHMAFVLLFFISTSVSNYISVEMSNIQFYALSLSMFWADSGLDTNEN